MSKAVQTGQVTVVSDGTTFHTILQCTIGDLYQTYEGDYSSPSNITPNFEQASYKPLLVFQAFSAQEGTGASYNLAGATAKWYVGDTLLSFDASGASTTKFGGVSGHFIQTTSDGNPALKIVKNLIGVNLGNSFLIACTTSISVDNTSVDLKASAPASITLGTENTKKVSIIATSTTDLFTIKEKGGKCTVAAMVISGDSESSAAYTYKWYLPDSKGVWTLKQDGSNKQFTVNEADVNSSTLVKLEVYNGNSLYGMDVQTINDVSDPYLLVPNCCTKNGDGTYTLRAETVRRSETGNLVYLPKLYKRGSTTAETGITFDMYWYDNAGNSVVSFTKQTEISIPAKTISDHNGLVYVLQTTT